MPETTIIPFYARKNSPILTLMSDQSNFPSLPCWKKYFPFSLGSTSFVHPAGYLENVKILAPSADHIQLLFFESRDANALPSAEEFAQMAELGRVHETNFTLHLPIDRLLDSGSNSGRDDLKDFILRLLKLADPVEPVAMFLHLAGPAADAGQHGIKEWQERIIHDLSWLADKSRCSRLCLENTDFPCAWLAPLCGPLNAKLCLDAGRLGLAGENPPATFRRHMNECEAIHLHAWRNDRDHLALDVLQPEMLNDLAGHLRAYTGLVTLEVFNHDDFLRSLRILSTCLNIQIPGLS